MLSPSASKFKKFFGSCIAVWGHKPGCSTSGDFESNRYRYFSSSYPQEKNEFHTTVTDQELKLPFYAKATIFLIGLVALFSVLYIAKGIIIPLVFATILAILLHPVVNFFVRIRINRIVAIAITLIITFLFLAGFSALLISQVSRFTDFWPVLVDKFTLIINQTISEGAQIISIEILRRSTNG